MLLLKKENATMHQMKKEKRQEEEIKENGTKGMQSIRKNYAKKYYQEHKEEMIKQIGIAKKKRIKKQKEQQKANQQ